ncbi:efflux RND transporter periplasmic adaptor subunit [Luteolibacter sp. GHJ8]|uniref:Efflux RND transporter periplasmic adaptor subunit n=1 Tax=Luteolibacter rhizosphaerae TaxID=2989719 RepID=A0ABT3G5T6_9BACT|nr:efflux RND transporter periplasmic adaptor subunit [Luteolibacter rhizosphaerae]MCW1915183.1 efflux RND transporter periplasmic adaptor subunit [Luteolibacter rhizosphaerae]
MESKPSSLESLRIDRSQTPLKSSSGKAWWVILTVILLAAGAFFWTKRPQAVAVKTAPARVQQGTGGSSAKTLLNATGYVTTRLDATVSSKVTGKVAEILVEEGMKVEKGQVLARLDDSNVQTALRLAEARLESSKRALEEAEPALAYAEAELNRLRGLEQTRAVSKTDYERAEAEARGRRAGLERLRSEVTVSERQVDDWKQQLDDTIIRAPFAGVVTTKDSQPGEMISPISAGGGFTRTGICTLVDMKSLEIEVDVGESFINRVKSGQPVEATLDAYPSWKIPCKVIAIIPTADRQKATVKVRVGFDQLDPRILPQMGVKVAFQSDEAPEPVAANAVLVPKDAVAKSSAGKDIIWVVREDKVERRAVTLGPEQGGDLVVKAGVSSGDAVVLNPPSTLEDGAKVTLEKSR